MPSPRTGHPTTTYEIDYAPDELEFLRAIDRYRAEGHPFPTWREVLRVLKGLGYAQSPPRPAAPSDPSPRPPPPDPRHVRGSRHGRAKLDEPRVAEVKARLAAGERQTDLAREFGVSQPTMAKIVAGLIWAHVPWPDAPA